MPPHGVERVLRSEEADALPVAGKAPDLFFSASLVRDADMNEPDGLLRRSAGRSRYAGDAHTDRRASLLANAVREPQCDFRADRALCFDELRGHAYKLRFHLVAVANDA